MSKGIIILGASGSMWSIREAFNPLFDLAVYIAVPTAVRMERLRAREAAMLGERILPGGDMYEQNAKFLEDAAQYETGDLPLVCLKADEQWMTEFCCPVLRADETKGVAENVASVVECFLTVE